MAKHCRYSIHAIAASDHFMGTSNPNLVTVKRYQSTSTLSRRSNLQAIYSQSEFLHPLLAWVPFSKTPQIGISKLQTKKRYSAGDHKIDYEGVFSIALSRVPWFYSLVLSTKAMRKHRPERVLWKDGGREGGQKCALMHMCGFSGSQACNLANFSKQR